MSRLRPVVPGVVDAAKKCGQSRASSRVAFAGLAALLLLAGCASSPSPGRAVTSPPTLYPGFTGYTRPVTTSASITVPAPDRPTIRSAAA